MSEYLHAKGCSEYSISSSKLYYSTSAVKLEHYFSKIMLKNNFELEYSKNKMANATADSDKNWHTSCPNVCLTITEQNNLALPGTMQINSETVPPNFNYCYTLMLGRMTV